MIEIDLLPESLRRGAGTHPAGAFSPLGGRNALLTLALWGSVLIVPPAVLSLWWTQRAEARGLHARVAAASADRLRPESRQRIV